MAYIQLPVGTFADDVLEQCDGALAILQKQLPHHEHGIQLFMGADDGPKVSLQRNAETIDYLVNEKGLPPESLTLHHPFSPRECNKLYNFYFPESMEKLRETAQLAVEKGIQRLTVHLSVAFYHPKYPREVDEQMRWDERWDNWSTMHEEVAVLTYEHLKQVADEYPSVLFGVENMCLPTRGEVSADPCEILIEPLMNSTGTIQDFLDYFEDCQNVGVCFDTEHFVLSQHFVRWMKDNDYFLPGTYLQQSECGNVLEIVDELVERGKLFDFQLSDAGQFWVPHRHIIEEGVQLLSGLGGYSLLDAAKRVVFLPNVGFSVDGNPQRENYSEEEWLKRYVLKKEQVEAIKLLAKEGVINP